MTMAETYGNIGIGLGLIAFGSFLHFLITAVLKHREEKVTIAAMEGELIEKARLNIAKLDQLTDTIPIMEESGTVPVFLPYRMSLATLHQANSTGQLRLLPNNQSQRRWRLMAETCESFGGFVDNTELVATISLLHTNGLTITEYRLRQLADQAKETKQFMASLLSEIDPAWKEQKA